MAKWSVRSVCVAPSMWSANAAQQKWLTSLTSCGRKKSVLFEAVISLTFAFGGMGIFGGAGILMIGLLGCMEQTPAGVFFMWPLAVAIESGRYLWTALAVRPGQEQYCSLLIALIYVDGGGRNAH